MQKEIVCKACGNIDDYKIVVKSNNHMAFCNGCGKFIKNVSYESPKFYFGKMKGKLVSEVTDKNYLQWFLTTSPSESMREAIEKRITEI